MHNKLNRAELLELIDNLEENGSIDIDKLNEEAHVKAEYLRHNRMLNTSIPTVSESKINKFCEENGIIKGEKIKGISDGDLLMERTLTCAPGETVKEMNMFSTDGGVYEKKPRKVVQRFPYETSRALDKLKALGIRNENYGRVKLGLLSYEEFLKDNPELLTYKRFKSVLKKLVGYQGIGHNLSKSQRILTAQSMYLRLNGENEEFNKWIENISETLMQQYKTNFRRRYEQLKCCKASYARKVKEFDVKQYTDTAIKYVQEYTNIHYAELMKEVKLNNDAEYLLCSIVIGLITLGYKPEQMLYTIIRPVLPKKNYKQRMVEEFYGSTFKIKCYNEAIIHVLEKLSRVSEDNIRITAKELSILIEYPNTELLQQPYEALMIPQCVELNKARRGSRICGEIMSYCRNVEWRFPEGLTEKAEMRLRKLIEDLKGLTKFEVNELEELNNNFNNENYKALEESVMKFIYNKKILDSSKQMEIAEANSKLPDRKSRVLSFLEDGGGDETKIFQICSEFMYGKPNY